MGITPPTCPWLTVNEAAAHGRCSVTSIIEAARGGRLRHAKLDGRRSLRFRVEWVDQWLLATSTPVEQPPQEQGGCHAGR